MSLLSRLLIGAAILVAIGLAGFFVYIDRIVAVAIEKGAEVALGVETKLDSLRLGFVSGEFGLSELRVSNPSGFERPNFIRLGRADVVLPLPSLMDDPLVVPLLALSEIEVSLERSEGKTNYGVILDNLSRLSSGEGKPASPPSEGGRGFIIQELVIRDITAHTRLEALGAKLSELSVEVPEIRLQNIGSGSENGIPGEKLVAIVTKAILQAIAKNGIGLPQDLARELGGKLTALGKAGVELQDSVTETGKQLQEDVKRGLEKSVEGSANLLDGVGGLLRGKKGKKAE